MIWHEVRAFVAASYRPVESGRDSLAIVVPVGAVEERVDLEHVGIDGEPWLLVHTAICRADRMSADAALRWNGLVAIGALAILGASCVIRAVEPLDGLTPRRLERLVTSIAREAELMKRPAGAGSDAHLAAFLGFCD
jgi:hypothetical protein